MMINFEVAKQIILDNARTLSDITINVEESFGYVLAEDIVTDRDFPDTKKSAVDGFAIKLSDRNQYKIIRTIVPGELVRIKLKKGTAVFVMTGAVVPENADAVVRVEDCDSKGDLLSIHCHVKVGDNINQIGEEKKVGEKVIKKGSIIDERVYPVLFYLGLKKVKVFQKPKVGIFTTGDELLDIGSEYKKGFVFNTNRYIVESVLRKLNISFDYYGNIKDDEIAVSRALKDMFERYDILISSGGVSMGKYDYIKKLLNEENYEILINRTKIKPGSPLIVAKNKKSIIFGMPGYPTAFFTNLLLYFLPYIKKTVGRKDFNHNFVKVELGSDMHSKEKSDYFNRANIVFENGKYIAYGLDSQKTSHFINFANCNGLVRIPQGVGNVNKGYIAEAILFEKEIR
ncbi:molybdopterin molybdotransferase MoeA [Deferribacter abyssi]|uniref:molybdopterin molybdotransferase MoeA n=1 Tax=Deferribacter abyssi TaxID=213806 RepID=UPI003C165E5B